MSDGRWGRRGPGLGVPSEVGVPLRPPPRSELPVLTGRIPKENHPLMIEDVVWQRHGADAAGSRLIFGAAAPPRRRGLGDSSIRDLTPAHQEELVTVRMSGRRPIQLIRPAAEALERLVAEARAAGIAPGPLLDVLSGYRTDAAQARIRQAALRKYGTEEAAGAWAARPGHSMHRTGRAMDLNLGLPIASEYAEAHRRLPIYQWLVENAPRFHIYPYVKEPWHWVYRGSRTSDFFTEQSRPQWPQSQALTPLTPRAPYEPGIEQTRPDFFTERSDFDLPQSRVAPHPVAPTPAPLQAQAQSQSQPDWFSFELPVSRATAVSPVASTLQQSRPDYVTATSTPDWPQSVLTPASDASVSVPLAPPVEQSRPDYFPLHERPIWPQCVPAPVQQSMPDYFPEHLPAGWPQSRP